MKKIAIIAPRGRLGAEIHNSLQNYQSIPISRDEICLSQSQKIYEKLANYDFDILINCSAYTNVDACETNKNDAFAINRIAVKKIAQSAKSKNAKVIHFSTDYVFDGKKENGYYSETDKPCPISVYGESKLAGEEEVLNVSDKNIVIRTSWVFGKYKPSFPDWIIQQAKEKTDLKIVANKFACPAYTHDIAQNIKIIIKNITEYQGIYHLCNSEKTSWINYAQEILNSASEIGIKLKSKKIEPITLNSIKAFTAKRPKNSALSCKKISTKKNIKIPSWQNAIKHFLKKKYI